MRNLNIIKIFITCVSLIVILSMTACVIDIKEYNTENEQTTNTTSVSTQEQNVETTSDIEETESEEEHRETLNIEDELITGYWVIDSVQFNDAVYQIEELKDLLNKEDYDSLLLAFEFTDNEVSIFINEKENGTTGYTLYEKNDDIIKYIDESGQLIFILKDNTLQIEQSQSTLILVKQIKENNNES